MLTLVTLLLDNVRILQTATVSKEPFPFAGCEQRDSHQHSTAARRIAIFIICIIRSELESDTAEQTVLDPNIARNAQSERDSILAERLGMSAEANLDSECDVSDAATIDLEVNDAMTSAA